MRRAASLPCARLPRKVTTAGAACVAWALHETPARMEVDAPRPESDPHADEPNSAAEKLGVEQWDRPAIFRETANAATETGLPYWLVLLLSGAIATLGLALNSSAVVIGAMLIAPLLAPIVGLALALAVGDGRLAVQMIFVVMVSTVGVVVVAAVLTAILPFHTVTPEILARTRPTTLDLAIAVFSGLAGAVVTVARRSRLSAAVPGVAIAVALVPPLSVAGFGIGSGLNWDVIWGALLLYGANLGGIVLSGMALFMLIGMQRPAVTEAAQQWHEAAAYRGFTGWLDLAPGIRSLGLLRAPATRFGLVVGFVLLVAFPLTASLREIARETRVERGASEAARLFEQPGRSSILSRQTILETGSARVLVRVATASWYGESDRDEFERIASARAGEPVTVVLEQLPAAGDDLDRIGEMMGVTRSAPVAATPTDLPGMLHFARTRVEGALAGLALPDSALLLDYAMTVSGNDSLHLMLDYAAPRPLSADARAMLAAQLGRTLTRQPFSLGTRHVPLRVPRIAAAGDEALQTLASQLRRYNLLEVALVHDAPGRARADTLSARLQRLGVAPARIHVRGGGAAGVEARLRPRPAPAGEASEK